MPTDQQCTAELSDLQTVTAFLFTASQFINRHRFGRVIAFGPCPVEKHRNEDGEPFLVVDIGAINRVLDMGSLHV